MNTPEALLDDYFRLLRLCLRAGLFTGRRSKWRRRMLQTPAEHRAKQRACMTLLRSKKKTK